MSEKTEKPTAHKLREARKKGQVAHSKEVNGTAGFIALLLVLWMGAKPGVDFLQRSFVELLDHAFSQPVTWTLTAIPGLETMLWVLALTTLPLFLAGALVSIVVGLAQTRGVFSADPLAFKWEKLNPVTGLKRIFSSRTLFEVVKMVFKIAAVGAAIVLIVRDALPTAVKGVYATSEEIMGVGGQLLFLMFATCAMVYVVSSAIDYAHQFYEFLKEQRMSKDDIRHEHKNLEGDPLIRAQRRSLARQAAMSAGQKSTVRTASVLVVNPTHYAVALYYRRGETPLPMVVDKGLDATALEMRRIAGQHGVPIIENRKLARKLHSAVQIDEYIPSQLVDEVAVVFNWLQQMGKSGSPHKDSSPERRA